MENDIELFENEIELYLQLCVEENAYDNLITISQSQWNYILSYIGSHVFKGTHKLKQDNNTNNYNFDKVNWLVDYYINNLCFKYDKEISIIGFTKLSCINDCVIYEWASDSNLYNSGKNRLTYDGLEVYKKLTQSREESLSNKLMNGRNPVGVIAILNRHYGWNSPYVAPRKNNTVVSIEQLPDISPLELTDNSDK